MMLFSYDLLITKVLIQFTNTKKKNNQIKKNII